MLIASMIALNAQAQKTNEVYQAYYDVGKLCPDYNYHFPNVSNYSKKQLSFNDFKGKWLVLDFWNKGCSACIKSFPETNELQKRYKDNVQFVLIGNQDPEGQINPLFNKINKKVHFQMPCVFDSVLLMDNTKIFELEHGMPFIVVIDPDGIVRGSGQSMDQILNGINIAELTTKNRPVLRDYFRDRFNRFQYDNHKPYLVDGNGGPDSNFVYRSILCKWTPKDPVFNTSQYYRDRGRSDILGKSIDFLYMYAYLGSYDDDIPPYDAAYGLYWPKAVIEVHDTSAFIPDKKTGSNMFSYSLKVPISKDTPGKMKHIMQQDLSNFFGYSAIFELRKMPCWKLLAAPDAESKLSLVYQKVDKNHAVASWDELIIKNEKIALLITGIAESTHMSGVPIIDETNLKNDINIYLDFIPNDLASMQKALRKYGLDLVKGEKEMKVLVIRDN